MSEAREYRFGNSELRPHRRELVVDGKPRAIGARAFDLLLALVERRDRVVGKNELLDFVWPGLVVEENNLQVHISTLRKVLGPQAIVTIPGRGYRFTAAVNDAHIAQAVPRASVTPRVRGNLPFAAPVLYGRERDLAQLRSLVGSHRLVTIVGMGGIGKSVLSQALAHELAAGYADGAWLVELAPIAEPSLVASAVAGVMQLQLKQGGIDEVASRLADRCLLLVLDNCEHLPQAASELASALYRHAPDVRLIATSREPLKLAEEHVLRLQGLDVPAPDDASARLAGSVALLQARVQALDSSFHIADRDLQEAADICRHLDGIPLAIEFAAARVPLFGVRGLREQLDDRFRVLTRGARLAQPRHQTLHSALEWSFTLLRAEQQVVFRRMGVFAGGFGLESAKRVCAGGGTDGWRVVDDLGDLVDKSLVVADSRDLPRYRLLETTRAFACGKLAESGDLEPARRAHAHAMLALFESACGEEFTVPLLRRLARHGPDLDNVRAALDWCFGPNGDAALGVALTSASAWAWREGASRPEGMRRLQSAFEHVGPQTPALVEARLCIEWALTALPQVGEPELARAQRGVELCRAMNDLPRLCLALGYLARTHAHRYDKDAALLAIGEQRRLFQSDWPSWLRALLFLTQGCVYLQGCDYESALAAYSQARELAAEMDDRLLLLHSLSNQEQCWAALGRWQECVDRGRELHALIERTDGLPPSLEGIVAGNLCMALLGTGAVDEALAQARHARPLFERMGSMLCLLGALAPLAFARGFAADAARIVGCANAGIAASGSNRERVETELHESLTRRLAQVFDPAELQRLFEQGAALSVDAAAALALRDEDTAARPRSDVHAKEQDALSQALIR